MSLFAKKDEQAGSGLDKPDPKSLKERISDVVETIVLTPTPAKPDTGNGAVQYIPPAD